MVEVPLRHNREFTALWAGQTVSAFGTSVAGLAYPLLVLALTGSPAAAGLVGSVLAATAFLTRLPAGLIADRVDRKRLMLACDAVRAVAVGSIGAAVLVDRVTLAHVMLVAVVDGAAGTLFAPAEAVAVRRVVAPAQVRDAVARGEARQQLAALVGPATGGVLFGAGRALPFLVDALSYAVSFAAVCTLRTPLTDPARPGGRVWAGLGDGVRWLWRQPFLRAVTLWLAAAGVLYPAMGLVTLVLARERGATAAAVGLVFTAAGAGGLAGALAAPWLLRRLPPVAVVVGYASTAAAATWAMLAVDPVWTLGVLGAVAFFPVPAVNALVLSHVALDVPDALHGRVVSATTQLTTLLHPVGPGVVGLLLAATGARATVMVCGVLFTVLAIAALANRPMRTG
ncbi:MFS transporter [Pseudonocardia kunmingensis]|uniref:Multidrug efflux pump Tap n=1 Tax=Pseudonocardia kunmingensis TaxID=630975 RepID=A0A543CX88_9PSEU|nr:MFS transporter [Pseudonocardia kunmingensis]TQM01712.1 putative MFS family arabinose efflux permease [Pseudonocardia kunmingensis]